MAQNTARVTRLQPEGLKTRVVDGHTLYSHVVVVQPGAQVFVAGHLARDAAGNLVGKGDMAAQIRQVGENIKIALAAAGCTLADIVKTTVYTTDMDAFAQHVDVRMDYFSDVSTNTTVGVTRLSHPDFLVEIEVVAAKP